MRNKDQSSSENPSPVKTRSTIVDVAARAGVSHITVSRYFNSPEKLSLATRNRVKQAVEALNYVPNAAAQTLVRGNSELVALVVPDITNTFFTTLARGVEDAAREEGYTLILGNTDEDTAQERAYLELLVAHRVRGIILAPTSDSTENVIWAQQRRIPVVLTDRTLPQVKADVVRADTRWGLYRLIQHLVQNGYTKISFVGGQPDLSSLQDRLNGYREAMREAGLNEHIRLGRFDRDSGQTIVESLIRDNSLPEAIVAANNKVVVGVLNALRKHHIKVPDDVAVACVDDIEPAAAIDPFLTAIDQPAYEMGRQSMEMLLRRINGSSEPAQIRILPVQLLIRRSCGTSPDLIIRESHKKLTNTAQPSHPSKPHSR